MATGENIYKLRKRAGISQEELAEKMQLSRQTISLWETNQTTPTIENLVLLKEIFNMPIDKIVCGGLEKESKFNTDSLDTICAALAYAMGIEPPKYAAEKNGELSRYIDETFDGEKADRIVMYNPDAIAQWIYEKYPEYLSNAIKYTGKQVYLSTVMPSVTPVCFGTMYTGAQPSVHGIQKYEKPVIKIDSLFDALLRAGKKVAIITGGNCSLAKIFLERDLDYYNIEKNIEKDGTAAVNAKAMEIILRDEHDFIVIYNGNYDSVMHKNGPESARTLAELRANDQMFGMVSELIKNHWKNHNTLVGFAMDHGCHEIDGGCGSHGLEMADDINIVHLYRGYSRKKSKA